MLFLASCNKKEEKGNFEKRGPVVVHVEANEAEFKDVIDEPETGLKNFSSRSAVDFTEEYMLLSELRAGGPTASATSATGNVAEEGIAAEERADLALQTRYGVAVFDISGNYLTDRIYEHGREGATSPLILESGAEYRFIAYSVNSKDTLPALTFSDPAHKTLATASFSVAGDADAMYANIPMKVYHDQENILAITFKHLFSQITTVIDARATLGYKVTEVISNFSPHMSYASVALQDASIAYTGTSGAAAIIFNAYGTDVVTSMPTFINAAANNTTSLTIDKLTVGPLVEMNLRKVLDDVKIEPGVKYTLTLTIKPKDDYLVHAGRPAVRINGTIWARHNLGADISADPDGPIDSLLHGDYYQWGRKDLVARRTSTVESNYDASYIPPPNAWNLSADDIPTKGWQDPCPTGYRIPSLTEIWMLIDGVVPNTVGDRSNSDTNYSGATVLTSKRKTDVKMTIPAQGYFEAIDNGPGVPATLKPLSFRGERAYFWHSLNQSSQVGGFSSGALGDANIFTGYFDVRASAYPIRCVAETL
ncbi:fimbrillin family protein [Sphingobacterium kitahiroshimense]|uniref:fimbrillin family protein n=1 Tax=Sphingobacterium kitahiroshimense TaxID=470446 RepID=UPI00320A579B